MVATGVLAGSMTGGTALVLAASEPTPPPAERGTSTIKVCVGKKKTVVSATRSGRCPRGSKAMRINRSGPPGPEGPTGPPGPTVTITSTVPVDDPSTTPTDGSSDVIDGGAP